MIHVLVSIGFSFVPASCKFQHLKAQAEHKDNFPWNQERAWQNSWS